MSRGHRRISGLLWAKPCERPKCIPRSRPRGVKGLGLSYERALAKALGAKAHHGPWFEFQDANGHGWCQPDFLLEIAGGLLILEVKLSLRLEAQAQIEELYQPVVELALARRAKGVLVTKYLKPETPMDRVVETLSAAQVALLAQGSMPILHWIGRGPL